MQGQWRGQNSGENNGEIVVEVDDLGDHFEGSAYLHESDPTAPATYARIVTPSKERQQTLEVDVFPLDPRTEIPTTFDKIAAFYPGIDFPTKATAAFEFNDAQLALAWRTNIGTSGTAVLPRSRATAPSQCPAHQMESWWQFKSFVLSLEPSRYIFRGQPQNWRLRTSFHRTGRANLDRYLVNVMPVVHRHFSATTKHFFDVRDPLQNAAFFNLVQHHGFPTPLLDWTYSPYVAAHFAFTAQQHAPPNNVVRIYMFDREAWCKAFQQIQNTASRRPHFSILEALAIENARMVPQQALSSFTNVDDIESYIASREPPGVRYLTAFDLPYADRASVLGELRLMGVTAGALFPGLDGTCSELRERFYPDY